MLVLEYPPKYSFCNDWGEPVHQQQRVSIVIRQARQSGEPTHIHSRPSWNRLKFQLIISGRNTKIQQLNPFLGRSIGISAGDGQGGLLLSSEGNEGEYVLNGNKMTAHPEFKGW